MSQISIKAWVFHEVHDDYLSYTSFWLNTSDGRLWCTLYARKTDSDGPYLATGGSFEPVTSFVLAEYEDLAKAGSFDKDTLTELVEHKYLTDLLHDALVRNTKSYLTGYLFDHFNVDIQGPSIEPYMEDKTLDDLVHTESKECLIEDDDEDDDTDYDYDYTEDTDTDSLLGLIKYIFSCASTVAIVYMILLYLAGNLN